MREERRGSGGGERGTNRISTSGLLCLSTVCDGKFLKHVAAVKVVLQASRYGFNAFA